MGRECREAVSRLRLDHVRRRGDAQAAARLRHQGGDQQGPDPGSALPRCEPGDHRHRFARRRHAPAPAVPRDVVRPGRRRPRGDAEAGAHVPQVRRGHDQAQPLRRQPRPRRRRHDQLDERRGSRDRGEGSQGARQARFLPRALDRIDQAGDASRPRHRLPRELRRRGSARHARGGEGPRLRRTGDLGADPAPQRRRGGRHRPRAGAAHGLRARARGHRQEHEGDAEARHPRAAGRRLRLRVGAARRERQGPRVLREVPRHDADGDDRLRHQVGRADDDAGQGARRDQGGLPRRPAARGRGSR